MPLSIARNGQLVMLPPDNESIQADDEILFCGTESGEALLFAAMNNPYTLDYLITGKDRARGYLFQWLENRFERSETPI